MPDWPTVRFEELSADEKSAITKPYGSAFTKADYTPHGIPVIRGVNLGNGIFLDDDFVFVSIEKADEMPGANLLPGDLVFTHRGTIGQVSMVPRSPRYPRYTLSTSQVKARLDTTQALPEFYYYWFRSPRGQESILAHVSTVGVPGLVQPVATIKSLRVPHPPLLEQQAVTEVLGALDEKIAANERLAIYSIELGRSLLQQATKVQPRAVTVGEFAVLTYGKALPEPKRFPGESPVFGCTGQVGWHNSPLTESQCPVVGRKGANAGHVSWMPKSGWVIDTAFFAKPVSSEINMQALYFLLDAAGLKSLIGDSAVPGVNRNTALAHPTRIPGPEQLPHFCEEARELLRVLVQAEAENDTLASLRDTLLPQLVAGKIRVKDAEKIVEDAA
ncbi:restriction endonuclease subunit S [Streptomyces sp. NPDC056987]|uniref:restriction endonuclease subunit S n=1 Tax=Streptomyces sp. NPDC056987 TaxID=3345988 RepID=UPI00362BBB43